MVEWPNRTLGDLVTLQRGIDLPTSKRSEGEVPVMGSFGITGYHNEAAMPGPGVTVGRSGASIGVVSYIDRDYWPLNTCLYVKDFHGNNLRFAYYLLSSLDLSNYNSGSAQPSLNRNYIHPIPLAFPARNEQDLVAELLGSLDDKIELNRRMNKTLEAMARAIFTDWFVDFGPTRAKAEGRAPYLAPELWDLFPDALDDEDKPVGWEFGTIGTLAKIKSGKRPCTKLSEPDGAHRVPVYGGNGISWYTNESLYNPPFLITGRVGTLGTVFRVYESVWVSDNALCCFPIKSKSFELLYFYLKSLDYDSLNAGSTQPLLTQTVLKAQEVIIGEQRVRDAFSDCIRPLFSRTVHGARESQTLAVVRDLLLPKLMSSEIRLREAERVVEAVA